jgi:hypothetical protein
MKCRLPRISCRPLLEVFSLILQNDSLLRTAGCGESTVRSAILLDIHFLSFDKITNLHSELQAEAHASPAVRAAGLSVVAALSEASLAALPAAASVWQWAKRSVAVDVAPAVRAAAARALGSLAAAPVVLESAEGAAFLLKQS